MRPIGSAAWDRKVIAVNGCSRNFDEHGPTDWRRDRDAHGAKGCWQRELGFGRSGPGGHEGVAFRKQIRMKSRFSVRSQATFRKTRGA